MTSSKISTIPVAELHERLVAERPTPCEAVPYRNTDNWVGTWIDPGQKVVGEDGRTYAERAITDHGQMLWMVHSPGRRYAFHASPQSADAAFAQAEDARRRRKAVARRWNEYKVLRRRIILGRVRLSVLVDDGREAGLCEVGIQGFLRRFGLHRQRAFSGRTLALLSFLDRQAGYAVLVAHDRHERASGAFRAVSGSTPSVVQART